MSANLGDYICPTGCTTDIPDLNFDPCAPEVNWGEIQKVAITKPGYPLTDVTDTAEWAARIASNGDDRIQLMTVVGDMPLPTMNETDISGCRKVYSDSDFVINLEVDETNEINYEFMRYTHCNPLFLAWVITKAHIRGGNNGIEANIILSDQIDKGCKSIQKFIGKMTWTGSVPARSINVLP